MQRVETASEAIRHVPNGARVFIHGAAATPHLLIEALVEQAPRFHNAELLHLHTFGEALYANEAFQDNFRVVNLFVGPNMRSKVDYDHVDYLPCFLSEIPALFRSERRPLDVALVHLSPPDRHGFCTLGTSVDVARAALEMSEIVIAQINPNMPRVHGDGFVHVDAIDYAVEVDVPIDEAPPRPLNNVERAIGRHVAGLVEDGATLQMGIGAIPDAVLQALVHHKHLGIHTEMWSDGVLPLIESGAVDNSLKRVHPGKIVSGFLMGSRRLYDYVDDNPYAVLLDIGYVNNVSVIARNPRVTAINSAVEVDLTGQVCADSVGSRIISGVGGQMDFIRGASLSKGGKPIIALPSRTRHGHSRIVTTLKRGAGVVTTRAHVHYVVTENGVADLYGKTTSERAQALIAIAHPDDRELLAREWRTLQCAGFV